MLFKPVLAEKIIWGEKWQTRRGVSDGDTWEAASDDIGITHVYRINKNGRRFTLYETGKEYPVQINYRVKAVGRIRITDIRRTFWDAIDDADGVAEGFTNRQGFIDYVTAMYAGRKPAFDIAAPCWALTFKFIPAPHTYNMPQFWRSEVHTYKHGAFTSLLKCADGATRWELPYILNDPTAALTAAQAHKDYLCRT